MSCGCVVIFYRRVRIAANRGHDIAFCDDFHFGPQIGPRAQRGTQNALSGISAINIRLIKGCDPLGKAGFDFCDDMIGGGIRVIAKPPHPVDKTAKTQALGDLDAGHGGGCFGHLRTPPPRGVFGNVAGTRPYSWGKEQVFICGNTRLPKCSASSLCGYPERIKARMPIFW